MDEPEGNCERDVVKFMFSVRETGTGLGPLGRGKDIIGFDI